jgi:hypothetical protein
MVHGRVRQVVALHAVAEHQLRAARIALGQLRGLEGRMRSSIGPCGLVSQRWRASAISSAVAVAETTRTSSSSKRMRTIASAES